MGGHPVRRLFKNEIFSTVADLATISVLFLTAIHASHAREPVVWQFTQSAHFLH